MVAVVGAAGIVSALLVASFSLLAPEKASDEQAARDAASLQRLAPDDGNMPRLQYPYSVVPGGVHSAAELAAAMRDPVVAAHYGTVNLAAARVDTVPAPRRVYVSYRLGDRIFWTKRTVTLSPGERILNDGRTEIRSRCGNCISDTPQEPTSDDEPLLTELDRAIVPFSDGPGADGLPSPGPPSVPLALIPLSEFTDPVAGDTVTFAAPVDGSVTPANIAIGGSPYASSTTGDRPPHQETSTSLIDVPGGGFPAGSPFDEPSVAQPVPVPEPGSILLVATGLAGGAWRAWRRRRRGELPKSGVSGAR